MLRRRESAKIIQRILARRKEKSDWSSRNTFMRHSREGTLPCAIMRFPDYYGPNAASIADGIFRSAIKGKTARWFGKLDVMHEFIFISDAAKAMIMAAERPEAFGQEFNVPGPEPVRVRDWITLVFKLAGFAPKMVGTGRLFVRLAGLFNSTARAFAEMQYLTEEPLILDGSKFNKLVRHKVSIKGLRGRNTRNTRMASKPRYSHWSSLESAKTSTQSEFRIFSHLVIYQLVSILSWRNPKIPETP